MIWFISNSRFFIVFDVFCISRSTHPEVFCKKGVLRNFAKFTGKRLCQSLFYNKVAGLRPQACNFIIKEPLAQVFSYEFCAIFKNTFSYRTPLLAASVLAPPKLLTYSLQSKFFDISQPLRCFTILPPNTTTDFSFLCSLF